MSRRCDLLDTGPMSGHNVSHSNIKTNRRFEVNLCTVTLASEGTKNHKLTDKAKKIKKSILKKAEDAEATAA